MKKTLTLLLIITSFSLSGQTTKGSFMIGGSGSISFDKTKGDGSNYSKSTSIGISPEVAYFFGNNLSVGLSLPLTRSWYEANFAYYPDEYNSHGYSTGATPVVRYYIPVRKFFIVTQAAYGWFYSKETYDSYDPVTGIKDGTDEYSYKYKGFSLAAGPAFFLSPYTSVEILANYRKTDYESSDQSTFYISIGLQIYIPKRNEE